MLHEMMHSIGVLKLFSILKNDNTSVSELASEEKISHKGGWKFFNVYP